MPTDSNTPPVPAESTRALVGDLAGLGAAGTKLLDMLESMTGTIARPWIIRRDGKATQDVEIADTDVESIRTIRRAEADARAALIAADTQMEIAERAARRLRNGEMRKQKNLETIVEQALHRIADMTGAEKAEAREIEPDWLQAFMDYAGGVSNERLREVWAQILSNQTSARRSEISFATIDSLRLLEPRFARALLRALQVWLVFGQCMDIVDAVSEEDETLRLYDRHYHSLCGIGFLELRSSQQTALTFKEFVLSFHDKRGKLSPIHVDALWPAWRGLELGEVLLPQFYGISMGLAPTSEEVCAEFAKQSRQVAILKEWAASLSARCDELRLSVLVDSRSDEHRRGRAGSRTVPTHRWTAKGWERLITASPEVLARVPHIVRLAEIVPSAE